MESSANWSGLKLFRHPLEIKKFLNGEVPNPIMIELHTTNKCNFNCIWCEPRVLNKIDKSLEMDQDTLFKLIMELKEFDLKGLLYSGGGEPLLNPATLPSMELANSLGISVGLFSNGALITDDIAKSLVKICTFVRISFDAGTKETHNKVHFSDSFENVLKAAESLVKWKKELKSNVTLGATFNISPENFMEAKHAINIFENIGFDYIQFRPTRYEFLAVGDYVLQSVRELIEREKPNRHIQLLYVPHFGVHYYGQEKRSYDKCHIYNFQAIITPNGDVYPCYGCVHRNNYPLGNVVKDSFKKLWLDKKLDLNPQETCTECRFHSHNELLERLKNVGHVNFI